MTEKLLSDNEKLILDFINGPLQEYLTGKISFLSFKEMVNRTCGTYFEMGDLYPSYLFGGIISYPSRIKNG